jgi:hypothetical protein
LKFPSCSKLKTYEARVTVTPPAGILLPNGPESSPNSSPNRSASKKYFVSWRRQVPALNRGQDGSRRDTTAAPYDRTLPIIHFFVGSFPNVTYLNMIRSIRPLPCLVVRARDINSDLKKKARITTANFFNTVTVTTVRIYTWHCSAHSIDLHSHHNISQTSKDWRIV